MKTSVALYVAAHLGLATASLTACDHGRDAAKQKDPAAVLDEVHQLIQKNDSRGALAALDRNFPNDKTPAIAEERARAYDVAVAACSTAPCRLAAAVSANDAHQSPTRTSKVDDARRSVSAALAIDHVVDKPVTQRIKQLREIADASEEVLASPSSDPTTQATAKQALAFANSERAKVPLLKLDLTAASDLLGPVTMNDHNVPTFALDGVNAYLAADSSGKCSGVYAVGSSSDKRVYKSTKWPAERLLGQAFGHPVAVKPPPTGSSMSRWYDTGVPVVVRWRDGAITEIRVGDATP